MDTYTKEETWLLREKYNGTPSADFMRDCDRLRAGEPLAYVIGFVPFLDTTISLDSRPLIPRSETEYWVKNIIEQCARNEAPRTILDLCAGSGCIGVAMLAALPHATVDFIEIDEAHHATILHNIRANNIDTSRAHIYGGDLFEEVGARTYDLILSNPPYINPNLRERVEESVRRHEPHQALWGGEGGLEVIEQILKGAAAYLRDGGSLYIEHEPEHTHALRALTPPHLRIAEQIKDQYGHVRVTHFTIIATPPSGVIQ